MCGDFWRDKSGWRSQEGEGQGRKGRYRPHPRTSPQR
jgi:hypothetical protein